MPQGKLRFTLNSAAVLILASLAINLGLGRWGSYLRGPLPGLHLADFLLLLGTVLAVFGIRAMAKLPRVAMVFLVPVTYLVVRTFELLLSGPPRTLFNWIRDMAPFMYMSLIPLIAIALATLSLGVTIWVVRWAAVVYAIGYGLTWAGVVTPFRSEILSIDSVSLFEYRGDFSGVVLGLGVLAWGRWAPEIVGRIGVQAALFSIGLLVPSRAATITLLALTAMSIWNDRKSRPFYVYPLAILVGVTLLLGIAAARAGLENVGTTSASGNVQSQDSSESALPLTTASSEVAPSVNMLPTSVEAFLDSGSQWTVSARLDTYGDVTRFLGKDSHWLWGGGVGSDALYEACTGVSSAPDRTRQFDESGVPSFLPKCDVDSYEAASTLRDPHNWLLNLWLYHGLIGLLAFLAALVLPLWTLRRGPNARFVIFGIVGILICSSFGVIISAPFGLVPVAVFLAYLLRPRSGKSTQSVERLSSATA